MKNLTKEQLLKKSQLVNKMLEYNTLFKEQINLSDNSINEIQNLINSYNTFIDNEIYPFFDEIINELESYITSNTSSTKFSYIEWINHFKLKKSFINHINNLDVCLGDEIIELDFIQDKFESFVSLWAIDAI